MNYNEQDKEEMKLELDYRLGLFKADLEGYMENGLPVTQGLIAELEVIKLLAARLKN